MNAARPNTKIDLTSFTNDLGKCACFLSRSQIGIIETNFCLQMGLCVWLSHSMTVIYWVSQQAGRHYIKEKNGFCTNLHKCLSIVNYTSSSSEIVCTVTQQGLVQFRTVSVSKHIFRFAKAFALCLSKMVKSIISFLIYTRQLVITFTI